MSRKLLSLAVLVAAFTVILGTTDAHARHCRSHHRNHRCCQNSHYGHGNCGHSHHGYANCGYQQVANYGCQPQVAMNACNPQPTCCAVQPACAVSVNPVHYSTPQPAAEQLIVAPVPAN